MLENLVSCFNGSQFDVMDIDSSFLAWIRATIEEAVPDEIYGFLNLTDDVLNFVVIVENDIKISYYIFIVETKSSLKNDII